MECACIIAQELSAAGRSSSIRSILCLRAGWLMDCGPAGRMAFAEMHGGAHDEIVIAYVSRNVEGIEAVCGAEISAVARTYGRRLSIATARIVESCDGKRFV
jgi:hypothetical protein